MPMIISPVRTSDLAEAFALLHGEPVAGQAFRLVARGELNPNDLFVATSGGIVRGAVYAAALPGSIGVIWPARTRDSNTALEDVLTAVALRHVSDVKVVQAFLDSAEADRANSLVRAGFQKVTRVLEMRRASELRPPDKSRLSLIPYRDADAPTFQDILVRSHEDSLDCSELNGVRTPDEILAGYCDCAPDQDEWFLARQDGIDVGVLIRSKSNLTFVGVVPGYRRKGIGRKLIEHAIAISPELSLIVDERNTPAIRLYSSLDFEQTGARDVYLKSVS
jgi:putative acetyltransferase